MVAEPSATAAHSLLHHAGNVVRVSRHESDATGEIEVGDEPCYFGGLFRLGWAVSQDHGASGTVALVGGYVRPRRRNYDRFHCAGTGQVGLQRGARVFGILTVPASVFIHCVGSFPH